VLFDFWELIEYFFQSDYFNEHHICVFLGTSGCFPVPLILLSFFVLF
jgi:hypothetical protein